MGMLTGFLKGAADKAKRVKGAEWAVLLLALGLAGSLLLSSGPELFGNGNGAESPMEAAGDALEVRLSRVLSSMEGAGAVEVAIHYASPVSTPVSWLDTAEKEEGLSPIGAIIIAEGAGDIRVRLELARAVQTLLQLDASQVEIFKMEPEKGAQ